MLAAPSFVRMASASASVSHFTNVTKPCGAVLFVPAPVMPLVTAVAVDAVCISPAIVVLQNGQTSLTNHRLLPQLGHFIAWCGVPLTAQNCY